MVSAPVYGDIKPEDDYTHPLGPEQNFNESMYFNFFDNARGFGGFLRIGNRANEKYAEVTLTLYQPNGTVLFNWKRPSTGRLMPFSARFSSRKRDASTTSAIVTSRPIGVRCTSASRR